MKTSLRQKFLIAIGVFASLLASFNLLAQEVSVLPVAQSTINSQGDFLQAVKAIDEIATKLYEAHQKYPNLEYSHVYDNNGALLGFSVTGVPQSIIADKISSYLMNLESLGEAVNRMNDAYMPDSNSARLTSRVSKKRAIQSMMRQDESEEIIHASTSNASDWNSSLE